MTEQTQWDNFTPAAAPLKQAGVYSPLLKESDILRVIGNTPQEQQASDAAEAIPAWGAELDQAIAAQRDPKARAILMQERQQRNANAPSSADPVGNDLQWDNGTQWDKPYNPMDALNQPPVGDLPGEYMRGLKTYLPQTKEIIGSAKVIGGLSLRKGLGEGPVGNYLINSGLENRANAEKEIQDAGGGKESDSFTSAWGMGPGALVDWSKHGLGQATGNILESVTLALAGSLAGAAIGGATGGPAALPAAALGAAGGLLEKTLLKKGVKELFEKLMLEQGPEFAGTYLKKEAGKLIGAPANLDSVADRVPEAQHIEPGEGSETATAPVVSASLKESADNTSMSISEAKKWLLGEIDKAIAAAPSAVAFDALMKTKGMTDEERFVVFDVPGDGKFKVLNFKERLEGFRETVEKTAGFKPVKPPSKHKTPMETVAKGSIVVWR